MPGTLQLHSYAEVESGFDLYVRFNLELEAKKITLRSLFTRCHICISTGVQTLGILVKYRPRPIVPVSNCLKACVGASAQPNAGNLTKVAFNSHPKCKRRAIDAK